MLIVQTNKNDAMGCKQELIAGHSQYFINGWRERVKNVVFFNC